MTHFDWQSPPDTLRLPPRAVHVWRFATDLPPAALETCRAWLSADEIARAARFHFAQHAQRFIARRGMLRSLLGRYTAQSPGGLIFNANAWGKPQLLRLPGAASDTGLHFSASHSHGWALIAFAQQPVGVDLEYIRVDVDHCAVAERFFSPAERSALSALAESAQGEAFFTIWARKEAYIKALGQGLSLPLDGFDVSVAPANPQLLAARGGLPGPDAWQLQSLPTIAGYAAAVCLPAGAWQVYCFDATIQAAPATQ